MMAAKKPRKRKSDLLIDGLTPNDGLFQSAQVEAFAKLVDAADTCVDSLQIVPIEKKRDTSEEVVRFGREECAAGRHDWDTDGEVDACCRPGCGFETTSESRGSLNRPDIRIPTREEMVARMNAEIATWPDSFRRIHLTEPMPPGITRVPTASRHLMVVRDMDDVNDTGSMHKRADFDQACNGSLVKVAPVVTGEQHESIDWAAVEKRLREENGAAGVVIAPDVRKTPSQSKATRVGQAATVSADAAIREWAAGMPGVPPDELEDAVALAISLATAAGL